MKKLTTILSIVGVFAVALWVLPVQAEMVSVGDTELAAISGKALSTQDNNANLSQLLGDSSLTVGADGSNGNVQIGYYQWNDDHSTETSNHKGANDQSGDNSAVQGNVVATVNAINWGAYAGVSYISGDVVDAGVEQESWATLYIGGF
jgi:hypothetical protein